MDNDQATVKDLQSELVGNINKKVRLGERHDIQKLNYIIRNQRIKIKNVNEIPEHTHKVMRMVKQRNENQHLLAQAFSNQGPSEFDEDALGRLEDVKPELIRKFLTDRTEKDIISEGDFIIGFNDPYRTRWDALILLMAIYNCILIPFTIAFEPPKSFFIEILNYIIDVFFYIDICVCFRVSYLTFEGIEIKDWRQIGFRYVIQGTFIFDLLSVLPFDAIIPV